MMSEIKQAIADVAHVTAGVTQKALENPKVGMGTGFFTALFGNVNASDIATWLGICLAAVSLYNQLMIARRNWKKSKADREEGKG